jgi:hypothetical protein
MKLVMQYMLAWGPKALSGNRIQTPYGIIQVRTAPGQPMPEDVYPVWIVDIDRREAIVYGRDGSTRQVRL